MSNKHNLAAMNWEPYQDLFGVKASQRQVPLAVSSTTTPMNLDPVSGSSKETPVNSSADRTLGYDIVANPESIFSERVTRLNLGGRLTEEAKKNLQAAGYIREILVGKVLLLAPTSKLFAFLGLESPYKRDISDEHSFLTWLTGRIVKAHPLVRDVQLEYSLGDSNSTIDVMAFLKDGQHHAYEIILSAGASNVTANVAKLQGKGCSQIILVCRDYALKEGVWATIRNAGFSPEFLASIRCTIFSVLLRERRALEPRR